MAFEQQVQSFIHKLEEGGWVGPIRFALLLAAVAAVATSLLFLDFRGLSHAKAMDQAQVAREIARGHGFTTLFLRPAALAQISTNLGALPTGPMPDTYNAPLNPLLNAPFLWLMRNSWSMTQKDILYPSDRVIACVQVVCFLLAVGLNFLIAERLFDRRLALLGMGLTLVAVVFWNFALAGLPQNLMLLIFSGSVYGMVRALEAAEAARDPRWWLGMSAACFGLLTLTHGLTFWIFLGALVFVALVFKPRLQNVGIMLAVFAVITVPWLVRTYKVCGSPLGIAVYSMLDEVRGSEAGVMRSFEAGFERTDTPTFRKKFQIQAVAQLNGLSGFLGGSLVAPIFFVALLHLFKRPAISLFRWAILAMWMGAVFGMCVFGVTGEDALNANNLHVLFIPVMSCYGLAFILYLWTRLEITVRLFRLGFFTVIYLISAIPLVVLLVSSNQSRVQWPPYVPPFIAVLNTWMNPNEIIASDMPWGVAWYADRKSLWLPQKLTEFMALHDYEKLGAPINGLYLTPVTGNRPLISDIVKGEYKEWAPFIMRNVNSRDFPLRAHTSLPLNDECIFYADHDRWTERTD